jgi:hypothetical protein
VKRVETDPKRYEYTDLAIQPVTENEVETLDLIHETAGGEAFLARKIRHDAILEAVKVAHRPAA